MCWWSFERAMSVRCWHRLASCFFVVLQRKTWYLLVVLLGCVWDALNCDQSMSKRCNDTLVKLREGSESLVSCWWARIMFFCDFVAKNMIFGGSHHCCTILLCRIVIRAWARGVVMRMWILGEAVSVWCRVGELVFTFRIYEKFAICWFAFLRAPPRCAFAIKSCNHNVLYC